MIANDSSPDVHEMREIFFGDQAPAACGLFARPGQVSADLPARDQCMRCGRPASAHAAAAGDPLRQLLDAGYEVSLTKDPEGYVAHAEGLHDGVATAHSGIAATPLGALEAAAFGAGLAAAGDYVPPTIADALATRLAELEGLIADQAEQLAEIDERTYGNQTLLIRALGDALRVIDKT